MTPTPSEAPAYYTPRHQREDGLVRSALASKRTRGAAALVVLAVTAASMWNSTLSAFSANTSNGVNSVGMGSVSISDNDSGTALFNVVGLVPGGTNSASTTNCVTVTYTGNVPSTIKMYLSSYNAADSGAADGVTSPGYLRMHVAAYTGGTCAAPTGPTNLTVAAPGDTMTTMSGKTDFSNGYGTGWTTATNGQTRLFKFIYLLDAGALTTAQGETITTNFVWEAQNN